MSDPVTRQEQLISAIAAGGDIISPVTREEMYLAYMAGDTSIVLPEPVTRKEQFLYQACLSGGSGGSAPVIQPISITENGTYEAPDGVDGYSPITVAIESGGGTAKPETGFVPTAWTTLDDSANTSLIGRIKECDYYGTTLGEFYFGVSTNYAEQFSYLKNVVFKDAIEKINIGAFYNCQKLSITSLPKSLKTIDDYVFNGCVSLTEITFDGTPSSISGTAFRGCSNLLTINVPWAEGEVANAPWGATNATINYNYTGG